MFVSLVIPLMKSIRPELATKYSQASSAKVVMTVFQCLTSGKKQKQTNSAADASAAAAVR